MFFSLFTNRKENKNLTLLIDVGSASVGVALADVREHKLPHLFATTRENIVFQEKLSPLEFLRAMNHALERALKAIQKKRNAGGTPAHIFCSLSSPWFLLKSRRIEKVYEKAIKIDELALQKILDEEVLALKNELKETLPEDDIKIVEQKIVQIRLNGYEIKNPYGQMASRIEIVATVGVSSVQVTERIERTVASVFHTGTVHFSAFPTAAFSAIRDIFPNEKAFLYFDITGEGTDISLVNNDLLMGTMSFPKGKNFFIREISAQFRAPHEAASSLLSMYLNGSLESKRQKQIEALMDRVQDEWLVRLEKTLVALGATGPVPRKLFFTSDADVSTLFASCLGRAKGRQTAGGALSAQYLDPLVLAKFASFDTEVVRDPFLVTEALFAAKVLPQLIK